MGNISLRQWWKVFQIIRMAFKGMSRKEVVSIFERGFLQDSITAVIAKEYNHIKEPSPLFFYNVVRIPPRSKSCFEESLAQGVIESTPSFEKFLFDHETEARPSEERYCMSGSLQYPVKDGEICKELSRKYPGSSLVLTLDDIAHMVFENSDILTKDGHWNIFYVRVSKFPKKYNVAVCIGYSKEISNSWVITSGKLNTINWKAGDKIIFPVD